MASTPFRVVNWSPNELIGEDKMDQMNSNMTWLRDNTPRVYYTLPSGFRRVEGVRIAAGRALIPPKKTDNATAQVYFNNLFSQGCQPIVTTGIVSSSQRHIFAVVNGLGSTTQPDNRGFGIFVKIMTGNKKTNFIKHSFYVSWMALGY